MIDQKSRNILLISINKIMELAFDITNDKSNSIEVYVGYIPGSNEFDFKIYSEEVISPDIIIIKEYLYFNKILLEDTLRKLPIIINKLEEIQKNGIIKVEELTKFGIYHSFFKDD